MRRGGGSKNRLLEACGFRHVLQPALQFGFQLAVRTAVESGKALSSAHFRAAR
jgi:hypothetical protein